MSDLVVLPRGELRSLVDLDDARLARFWAGKSAETRKAYLNDIEHFARSTGHPGAAMAIRALIGAGRGAAHELVHGYLGALLERQASPSQVNRRLTALRMAISLCRQFDLCDWELEIRSVTSASYRDTAGPGLSGVRALVVAASAQGMPDKAARDVALIRMLYDIALRRKEVAELDLEDVDFTARRLSILGKGRREREFVTLPDQTCAALTAWIAYRGDAPGPLFRSMDNGQAARKGDGRLTGDGIYRIITSLGKTAGFAARPHGLRHAAITRALDATGGDMRAVQRFSRHKDIRTLETYDDNRTDMGGDIARTVAASLEGDGK